MSKNAPYTVDKFRKSGNGVLLATGSTWEGIDFPGDCVSLLIIPRLPFAFPDARMEQMREAHTDLKSYIQSVIVPDMQIKLRQGFGRAIRTETDTCVIAILDERAQHGGRYHKVTLDALPAMKVSCELSDVAAFIKEKKAKEYFEEVQHD